MNHHKEERECDITGKNSIGQCGYWSNCEASTCWHTWYWAWIFLKAPSSSCEPKVLDTDSRDVLLCFLHHSSKPLLHLQDEYDVWLYRCSLTLMFTWGVPTGKLTSSIGIFQGIAYSFLLYQRCLQCEAMMGCRANEGIGVTVRQDARTCRAPQQRWRGLWEWPGPPTWLARLLQLQSELGAEKKNREWLAGKSAFRLRSYTPNTSPDCARWSVCLCMHTWVA